MKQTVVRLARCHADMLSGCRADMLSCWRTGVGRGAYAHGLPCWYARVAHPKRPTLVKIAFTHKDTAPVGENGAIVLQPCTCPDQLRGLF